jgi:hypothetical protein
MNRSHMMLAEDAIRTAERNGYVARRSRDGRALHVYTGEADKPGTWMEVARTMIDSDNCVSRHALRDVLRACGV